MILNGREIDNFVQAYIECALWSTNDESRDDGGDPLDKNYSAEDIAPETLDAMIRDCDLFRTMNRADLALVLGSYPKYHRTGAGRGNTRYTTSDAGHDLWLSRNGHGAGFFDQNPDDDGRAEVWERLQDAARRFGEVNLYVHEGKVHHG